MVPRGREPEGAAPLSNAARQARYRGRHKQTQPSVTVRTRHSVDRGAASNVGMMPSPNWSTSQAGCAAWLDAMPESLRGTATAEALQTISDLDLDMLTAIEPPRGYGRD
jgi:hypothetical protein